MSAVELIGKRFTAGITGLDFSTYEVVDVYENSPEYPFYDKTELLVLLVDPTTDKPTFKRCFVCTVDEYKKLLNHPDSLLLTTKRKKCTYSSPAPIQNTVPLRRPILRKNPSLPQTSTTSLA
jgi:hypothetical protein